MLLWHSLINYKIWTYGALRFILKNGLGSQTISLPASATNSLGMMVRISWYTRDLMSSFTDLSSDVRSLYF